MNEDLLTPEDQLLLDRLVDGELTESERRELLMRLERSPDGWRRCALAFLEAQAWRGEARALLSERVSAPAPVGAYRVSAAGRTKSNWSGLGIWLTLATAAGFLLAVGYLKWFDGAGGAMGTAVGPVATTPSQAVPQTTLAGGRNDDNLRLVVAPGPGGERRVVDVPLVESERMNEALFGPWSQQQLPQEVLRMLEQNGNQVVRERRLMPFDLQDGRRVVVPMDQLEIRPVGNQSFQ